MTALVPVFRSYVFTSLRQRNCCRPTIRRIRYREALQINRDYSQTARKTVSKKSIPPQSSSPAQQGPNYARWIVGGLAVSAVTAYISYSVVKSGQDPFANEPLFVPEDVSQRYNETAKSFDSEVGLQETLMGLGWLRSWLTRRAEGNVLEVSVGTGRNSSYYKLGKCQSISMLDQSQEMIQIAQAKFKSKSEVWAVNHVLKALIPSLPLDPIVTPPGGFDTVLQTMGLCSTPNPVQLLRHMGSVTNPDTGKILLLEHGRSHYDWLNKILDSGAPQHAHKHGCWWNKDIGKIVEESGLQVVKMKRYHFGTTWWIELKPKKDQKSIPNRQAQSDH